MLVPTEFIDQLCERISGVVVPSFWQPGQSADEGWHTPGVHAQYLSADEQLEANGFPRVQVIITDGAIPDFSSSVLTVQIVFGAYSEDLDRQGWRTAVGMMWAVLQNLLERKSVGSYMLTTPVTWNTINPEEPSQYFAQLNTKWTGGAPAVSVPMDEYNLGKETSEKFAGE
jgi:hypothetical protein